MQNSNDKYLLRLPSGLRERIRQAAEINRRSMNGEIVYQLEQVLPVEKTKTAPGEKIGVNAPGAVRS